MTARRPLSGETGSILQINPSSPGGTVTVPVNGSNDDFVYHEAYTDGQFVFDPFVSPNPIPEADYLNMITQLNPGVIITTNKPS